MASFRCHENFDANKTWTIKKISSFYITAVVTFFRYLCRGSKQAKWDSILPKKSSRTTLKTQRRLHKQWTEI